MYNLGEMFIWFVIIINNNNELISYKSPYMYMKNNTVHSCKVIDIHTFIEMEIELKMMIR